MATTYTITVQSTVDGNKYFVDGVQQDSLTLEAGQAYVFDQSDASNTGHPLALSRTDNGTHGGGVAYTNGVIVTGTAGTDRVLTFTAPNNAPSSLYYYCQVHSGMGGSITVQNQTDNDPIRNFFKTLIVGEYSTTDTQLDVISTDAPSLPDPAVSGAYNLTIFSGTDSATSERFEIVRVTAKSNDTLTVVRAQEGTDALDMQDPNHVFGVVYSATKKTFDDIKAEIDQAQLDIQTNATNVQSVQDELDAFTVADQDLNTTDDVTFNSVVSSTRFTLPQRREFPTMPSVGDLFIDQDTKQLIVFNGVGFQKLVGNFVLQTQLANANALIPQIAGGPILEPADGLAFSFDANAIALGTGSRLLEFAGLNAGALVADMIFQPIEVDFLLIAGGGSGGNSQSKNYGGGGGGAGGYICSLTGELSGENSSPVAKKLMLPGQNYSVTIGAGGSGTQNRTGGQNGGNDSVFDNITANFGGAGESGSTRSGSNLSGGGSGGGAESYSGPGGPFGGTPNQGHSGGTSGPYERAGGGGGAGENGFGGGGRGGNGIQSSINGTPTYRAGGGGGGFINSGSPGGLGGGGAMNSPYKHGAPGQAHTGSGGGGSSRGDQNYISGSGGSGILILNYPDTYSASLSSGATSLSGEITIGNGRRAIEIITSGDVKIQ